MTTCNWMDLWWRAYDRRTHSGEEFHSFWKEKARNLYCTVLIKPSKQSTSLFKRTCSKQQCWRIPGALRASSQVADAATLRGVSWKIIIWSSFPWSFRIVQKYLIEAGRSRAALWSHWRACRVLKVDAAILYLLCLLCHLRILYVILFFFQVSFFFNFHYLT